jgi:ABC-type amino acid transport substrate-binding protein
MRAQVYRGGMRRLTGVVLLVAVVFLTECQVSIPADPDGTLESVTGSVLRAGASPNGDLVVVDGGEDVSGVEADIVEQFAASVDATVEWTIGSEEALVRGLDDGRLDLAVAGFSKETPWVEQAGVTRPYLDVETADGASRRVVMLVPIGENAFLSELETFLTETMEGK